MAIGGGGDDDEPTDPTPALPSEKRISGGGNNSNLHDFTCATAGIGIHANFGYVGHVDADFPRRGALPMAAPAFGQMPLTGRNLSSKQIFNEHQPNAGTAPNTNNNTTTPSAINSIAAPNSNDNDATPSATKSIGPTSHPDYMHSKYIVTTDLENGEIPIGLTSGLRPGVDLIVVADDDDGEAGRQWRTDDEKCWPGMDSIVVADDDDGNAGRQRRTDDGKFKHCNVEQQPLASFRTEFTSTAPGLNFDDRPMDPTISLLAHPDYRNSIGATVSETKNGEIDKERNFTAGHLWNEAKPILQQKARWSVAGCELDPYFDGTMDWTAAAMKQPCGHPDYIGSDYNVTSDLENGETSIGLDSFHILTHFVSAPGDVIHKYGTIHDPGRQCNNQQYHDAADTYGQVERKRCFVSRNRGVTICAQVDTASSARIEEHFLESASQRYHDLDETSLCAGIPIWPLYLSCRDLLVTLRLTGCIRGSNILGFDLVPDSFVFFGILLIYMITVVPVQNKCVQFSSAIWEGTYCPLIAHGGRYPLEDVSLLHLDLIGMSMRRNVCQWFTPLTNLLYWKHMMHMWLEEIFRICDVAHRTIICHLYMSSHYRSSCYPKETDKLDRSATLEISISLFVSPVSACWTTLFFGETHG